MGPRIRVQDLSLAVRTHRREQDLAIAEEVIHHDCYQLRPLRMARKRMSVILDVGGHIGAFGVFAKTLWPEAFLVAVEPNKESAALYRENLDLNGIEGAIVLEAALSYNPRKQVLVGDKRSTGGCVLVDVEEANRLQTIPVDHEANRYRVIEREVPTVTLEQIFDHLNLDEISLMKLDCEGSEFDLFQAVSESCSTKVKLILGEYHAQGGFERFALDARRAFPHLYFFGDSPQHIGPFWALPSMFFAARYSFARQLNRARRKLFVRPREPQTEEASTPRHAQPELY
ncbi:MAG: FkbM family methyltransferase [Bdellovibrionota bacterium]